MLKLTKTGIGLLTKQYRSVLRKCLLLNLELAAFLIISTPNIVFATATEVGYNIEAYTYDTSAKLYTVDLKTEFDGTQQSRYYRVEVRANNAQQAVIYAREKIKTGWLSYKQDSGEAGERYENIYSYGSSFVSGTPHGARDQSELDTVNELIDASTDVSITEVDDVFFLPSSEDKNILLLDSAIGAKIASDGHYIKKSDTNSITANLSALDYALYNYYYTKDEISNSSVWKLFGSANGNYYSASAGTASVISALDAQIKVNSDAITNVYTKSEVQNIQLLNYYYTFRVDERDEVIDSTSFFQKDFSTPQKVDLHIKNPTHLGAFTKCDEVCPRPSERFSLSLSQEQMFRNDASIDAGTLSICSLQIENVNEKLSNMLDV